MALLPHKYFMILVGIICIVFTAIVFHKKTPAPPQQEPILVAVQTLKQTPLQRTFSLVGTLQSENAIQLASDVDGIVESIHFQSGEYIAENALLITLKHTEQKAAVAKAKAAYENISDQYRRALVLYHQKLLAETDMMQLKFKQQEAKADWDQTMNAYEQRFIKAPFSGQLGIRKINLGQYIEAGQTIVNLHAIPVMYVDFSVPESVGKWLKTGLTISITKSKLAEITAIDASLDANTRTLNIRAKLLNPSDDLRPGAFVTINIDINTHKKVLLVPTIAVDYSPYGASVYVIHNNKAIRHYIQIKTSQQDHFIVQSGLQAGDRIVIAGQDKLHDGTLIKVIEP